MEAAQRRQRESRLADLTELAPSRFGLGQEPAGVGGVAGDERRPSELHQQGASPSPVFIAPELQGAFIESLRLDETHPLQRAVAGGKGIVTCLVRLLRLAEVPGEDLHECGIVARARLHGLGHLAMGLTPLPG